jgi:hypothetical protein
LSLPARTPRPLLPIVLAGPNSSPIVAYCPRRCKRPAIPESNSLALPCSLSIVPPYPVLSSCAHLLLPLPCTLPVLPPCVRVCQTKANLAKLDKVKQTIVSRLCVSKSALYCSFGSALTKIAEDRRRSKWFRDRDGPKVSIKSVAEQPVCSTWNSLYVAHVTSDVCALL